MAITRDIRNLGLEAGDPVAFQSLASSQARNIAQNTPDQSQLFGLALMGLLKQYQKLGGKSFVEQGFAARETQLGRVSAQTSPDLLGASPGMQAGVRSASAEALQPTISGARSAQQTFGEQIQSFGDVLSQARGIMAAHEASQARLRDDTRNTINTYIREGGSGALEVLLREQPDIFKLAGMDTKTVSALIPTLRAKEEEGKAKLLTPAEAARLGVPYGTTRVEAAALNVTPSL